MVFRKLQVCRGLSKAPDQLSGPVFRHTGEMMQHNAKAQFAVNLYIVRIRTAHQTDATGMNHKAVSLTVQITGRKRCCIEGLPEHIIKEADVVIQFVSVAPGIHECHVIDAALLLHIFVLRNHIHIGHAANIEPQALHGLFAVAERSNGSNLQIGVNAERLLDIITVCEGQPAGIQIHIRQLQNQVLHDVSCIQICHGVSF